MSSERHHDPASNNRRPRTARQLFRTNVASGVGEKYLLPLAWLLMSSLFIWDCLLQLRNPSGTAQFLARVHVPVPDLAIWISIPVHPIGGLALLLGFRTRWAAALLTLVCLGTAFGVHLPEGDSENMIHFYKNLVMAGGVIYVMTYGAGGIGIDKTTAP